MALIVSSCIYEIYMKSMIKSQCMWNYFLLNFIKKNPNQLSVFPHLYIFQEFKVKKKKRVIMNKILFLNCM